MTEITGSPARGPNIVGWVDGETQIRIRWRGTDGNPGPHSAWTEYERVVSSEGAALRKLQAIDQFASLELISAEVEPLAEVLACPKCDKLLEHSHAGLSCLRCARIVPGDELDRTRSLSRFLGCQMDVIDQGVSTGKLPG